MQYQRNHHGSKALFEEDSSLFKSLAYFLLRIELFFPRCPPEICIHTDYAHYTLIYAAERIPTDNVELEFSLAFFGAVPPLTPIPAVPLSRPWLISGSSHKEKKRQDAYCVCTDIVLRERDERGYPYQSYQWVHPSRYEGTENRMTTGFPGSRLLPSCCTCLSACLGCLDHFWVPVRLS